MISKIKPHIKTATVSTDVGTILMYVHPAYKEVLNTYKDKYGLAHPLRFSYNNALYKVLEDAYHRHTVIPLCNVINTKTKDVFKYLDMPGLVTYDIPIECFSDAANNVAQLELLRSFL